MSQYGADSVSCSDVELWIQGQLSSLSDDSLAAHFDKCEGCRAKHDEFLKANTVLERARAEAVSYASKQIQEFLRQHSHFLGGFFEHWDPATSRGGFGDFQDAEICGFGGMGIVFRAFDRRLERSVAVKCLHPDYQRKREANVRFSKEAKAMARLRHENIVTIFDVGERKNVPYLVMDFLEGGETLAARLKKKGHLEVKDILTIGMQVAAGLSAAHDKKVIHRDLKPANIMLTKGLYDKDIVTLLDFGLAKLVDQPGSTPNNTLLGTPPYMSPEQARGDNLDAQSDLFAFGTILYEMCTGLPPFGGPGDDNLLVIERVKTVWPKPISTIRSDVPDELVRLVSELHEKERDKRLRDAEDVGKRLKRVADSHTSTTVSATSSGSVGGASGFRVTRRDVLWGLSSVAAGAAMWVWGSMSSNTGDPKERSALARSPSDQPATSPAGARRSSKPSGEAPDLQYFPDARVGGKASPDFQINHQPLGIGAEPQPLPGGGLRILRKPEPDAESFLGITLTVRRGSEYESWEPYLNGEFLVVFSPDRPGEAIRMKAEVVDQLPGQGIIGEVTSAGVASDAVGAGNRRTARIPVDQIVGSRGEPFDYEVTRITIQVDIDGSSEDERWFDLHRVLLTSEQHSGK